MLSQWMYFTPILWHNWLIPPGKQLCIHATLKHMFMALYAEFAKTCLPDAAFLNLDTIIDSKCDSATEHYLSCLYGCIKWLFDYKQKNPHIIGTTLKQQPAKTENCYVTSLMLTSYII